MTRQKGFTLIELVVVIIILGILAVTAAPKFINLSRDAHIAVLNGAQGALQSANSLIYSKSLIVGMDDLACASASDDGCKEITVGGSKVLPTYGSIKANKTDLENAVELDDGSWDIVIEGSVALISPEGQDKDTCRLAYTSATDSARPDYTIKDDGC